MTAQEVLARDLAGHLSQAIKTAEHVGGCCREADAGRGLVEARERGKCEHAAPPAAARAMARRTVATATSLAC
jgi:hypothetical protein